jgi:hypothetical protein
MNNKFKMLAFFFMTFMLMLGINFLYAGQGTGRGLHMTGRSADDEGPWMLPDKNLLEQVGLTPEQTKKIDALNSENQKAVITKQAEIRVLRVDLRTEMRKVVLDMYRIGELADRISRVEAELSKMNIMHSAQLKNVMTRDQRIRLRQLHDERRQKAIERYKKSPDPGSRSSGY